MRPTERLTAEDWEQAVSNIFAHYPPDIFPPDSDSPDAKAGTWARKVCLNVITEAWRVNTERLQHERDRREGHVTSDPGVLRARLHLPAHPGDYSTCSCGWTSPTDDHRAGYDHHLIDMFGPGAML